MGVKYMCECCGAVFEPEEAGYYDEETGFHGIKCPACDSLDYWSEAEECRECGEMVHVDELHNGYCEDCVNNMLNDDEYVREYIVHSGIDDFWEILKSNYSEDYLVRVLMAEFGDEARDYCSDDLDSFAEVVG